MPRARNLKHSFFMNDELAEHDPLGRLLFAAMWCLADYKGDMEWREKKVKAQTLPYDDCDILSLAINLDKSGFIRFYSDGDKTYVRITGFDDHQNPHKNERDKGSEIPEYSDDMRQLVDLKGLTINLDKSGLNQDKNETNPADSCSLNPDSCSLNPDSCSLNSELCCLKKKTLDDEKEKAASSDDQKPKKISNYKGLDYSSWPDMPDDSLMSDWMEVRKKKKAANTQTAINGTGRQLHLAVKAGYTVNQCISESVERSWSAFKFEWLTNAGVKPENSNAGQFAGMNYGEGVMDL